MIVEPPAAVSPSTSRAERTVRGDGVDLAVTERGPRTAPTLVFVHGYPDTQHVWDGVAARLEDRYHVVTYDVRGAGRSSAPKHVSAYTMRHLSADLEHVLDAVSPSRAVHLVGHDWGSIQSWESVTEPRFESRLKSFTSISGPCLDHVGLRMRADLARRAFGDVARQSAKSWYIGVFHLPMLAPILWASGLFGKALQRVIAAEGARSEAPAIADGTRGIRLYRANMLPRLLAPRDRRTNVPVQFIVPRRDAYVSPWLSTGLDDRIPVAFRREVEGRHWLPLSQPENVARWVDEMVRFTEGEDVGPDFARLRGTGASQR